MAFKTTRPSNRLWVLGCPQGYVLGVDDVGDIFNIKIEKKRPLQFSKIKGEYYWIFFVNHKNLRYL